MAKHIGLSVLAATLLVASLAIPQEAPKRLRRRTASWLSVLGNYAVAARGREVVEELRRRFTHRR